MNVNNHQEKKSGGHFFNGFFWGAAIGGGFAYILSTKKGRELLKDVVQDGLTMLDDLTMEPEMAEEELSPLPQEKGMEEPSGQIIQPHIQEEQKPEPSKKRFFKTRKK